MKIRPKNNEKVFYLEVCAYLSYPGDMEIQGDYYGDIKGPWKFNLFKTRKEAQEARRKIISILKGDI